MKKKNLCSNEASTSSNPTKIDPQLTKELKDMLDANNPLVHEFRMAGQRLSTADDDEHIRLRLIGRRDHDGRTHNLPTASEVAALIVGDFDTLKEKRDIIVHMHGDKTKRISELHVEYLALQYPLLFPYAEDGYRTDIYHRGITDFTPTNKRTRVTMREWFAHRLQDRTGVYSLVLHARRLFQQFLVDGYTMVESERMKYYRKNQKELRCETYTRLASLATVSNGPRVLRGKKVILPSSHTGSPRYMLQNYLDAMSICKVYGYPDLFITFTCNPSWPEINRYMDEKGLKSEDRPDATTRVFKMKLDMLMKDFKQKRTFGRVKGGIKQYFIKYFYFIYIYFYLECKNIQLERYVI